MDKPEAPQAPDPSKILPLQGKENKSSFDYTTAQNKVNTYTPFGQSTWSKNEVFDEKGWQSAWDAWNTRATQGAAEKSWVEPIYGMDEGNNKTLIREGYYVDGKGGTNFDPGLAPDKSAFTTYRWDNTQSYSPEQQQLFDAKQQVGLDAAGMLPSLWDTAKSSWTTPSKNYDTYNVSKGQMLDPNDPRLAGPDWELYQRHLENVDRLDPNAYRLGNLNYYDVNRGDINVDPGAYEKTAAPEQLIADWGAKAFGGPGVRDWAGLLGPGFMQTLDKLGGLDAWQFDQEGSDAMYRSATRYLDPKMEQQQKQMEARLGEQGFVPGTPAYNQAMEEFMNSRNLSYADARDRALLAGREFGNQAFDNMSGTLGQIVEGMLGFGKMGLETDLGMTGDYLDRLKFGLDSDKSRSDEVMDIAKFLSEENQFASNFGIDRGKLNLLAQGQDFDQQVKMNDLARQRGLDANDVIKQQFGMDSERIALDNKLDFDLAKYYLEGKQNIFDNLLSVNAANNKTISADNAAMAANQDYKNAAVDQYNKTLNDPIAKLLTALGLVSPGQLPGSNVTGGGGINATDIAGLFNNQYSGQLNQYNADVGSNNATMGAIASVVAAIVV